jgi:hypothetical protein
MRRGFEHHPELEMIVRCGWAPVAAVLVVFASLHGCAVGAADTSSVNGRFCDPSSSDFATRKPSVTWQSVDNNRIAEADYFGRVFEARIQIDGREQFAYKVAMNVGGGPAFVSVALLDRPQDRIDVQQLAAQARLLLQNEALKVVREQRLKQAYPTLASNRGEILLWSHDAKWYFTARTPERFEVFAIVGGTVEYVCTHRR